MSNGMWKYVIAAYAVFWVMLIVIGVTAVYIFEASDTVMRFVTAICSWAPTIALIIMFKKLEPNSSLKKFYKNAFSNRIDFKLLTWVAIIMFGIFLLATFVITEIEGTMFSAAIIITPAVVLPNLFFSVIQGASGEESGWRGYLLPRMEKRYGFVKGNLILGLVWAFWHLPLWFLSGDNFGFDLVVYIIVFVMAVMALSFFIGVIMKKSNNLFTAFWLHFIFNFSLSFYIGGELEILTAVMVGYMLLAIASYFINRSKLSVS